MRSLHPFFYLHQFCRRVRRTAARGDTTSSQATNSLSVRGRSAQSTSAVWAHLMLAHLFFMGQIAHVYLNQEFCLSFLQGTAICDVGIISEPFGQLLGQYPDGTWPSSCERIIQAPSASTIIAMSFFDIFLQMGHTLDVFDGPTCYTSSVTVANTRPPIPAPLVHLEGGEVSWRPFTLNTTSNAACIRLSSSVAPITHVTVFFKMDWMMKGLILQPSYSHLTIPFSKLPKAKYNLTTQYLGTCAHFFCPLIWMHLKPYPESIVCAGPVCTVKECCTRKDVVLFLSTRRPPRHSVRDKGCFSAFHHSEYQWFSVRGK